MYVCVRCVWRLCGYVVKVVQIQEHRRAPEWVSELKESSSQLKKKAKPILVYYFSRFTTAGELPLNFRFPRCTLRNHAYSRRHTFSSSLLTTLPRKLNIYFRWIMLRCTDLTCMAHTNCSQNTQRQQKNQKIMHETYVRKFSICSFRSILANPNLKQQPKKTPAKIETGSAIEQSREKRKMKEKKHWFGSIKRIKCIHRNVHTWSWSSPLNFYHLILFSDVFFSFTRTHTCPFSFCVCVYSAL